MIAENEIRIGNWFKHNSDWSYRNEECIEFDFEWEYGDWYALGECTLNLNDISPIPLTEEWLLKIGFCCKRQTNVENLIEYSLLSSYRGSWGYDIKMCVIDKLYILYSKHDIVGRAYIKYVHDLQNFVYSITKHELTLKEKL